MIQKYFKAFASSDAKNYFSKMFVYSRKDRFFVSLKLSNSVNVYILSIFTRKKHYLGPQSHWCGCYAIFKMLRALISFLSDIDASSWLPPLRLLSWYQITRISTVANRHRCTGDDKDFWDSVSTSCLSITACPISYLDIIIPYHNKKVKCFLEKLYTNIHYCSTLELYKMHIKRSKK